MDLKRAEENHLPKMFQRISYPIGFIRIALNGMNGRQMEEQSTKK